MKQKFDKDKVLSLLGLIVGGIVTTLISNKLTEREIKNQVNDHFAAMENKGEA